MIIKNKKIFISGGAGVIGIELVNILSRLGAIILVGDKKDKPDTFSNKIQYRKGDLNYLSKQEIDDFKPDIFIHLAATFERTNESLDFYDDNYWNNINLSNKLARLFIKQKNIKKIIFASSYLIYDSDLYLSNLPLNKPITINEKNNLNPRNLIGLSKYFHENELNFLKKFYKKGPNIVSIRIFRGYGKNSRDVISRWIRSSIKNEELNIYRTENMFDFIYSKDSAQGIVEITKSNFEGQINLGTGKSVKISEIISYLKSRFKNLKYNNIKSNIKYESSQADISLLKKYTRWQPKYNIKKGIDEIILYEKNNIKKINKNNDIKLGILVTSSGSKFSLINCLKESAKKISDNIDIVAGDSDSKVLTNYDQIRFWKMPKTIDKNLEIILNFCKKNNISIIVPTRDKELIFWSKNKKFFKKNNIHIIVANKKNLEICIDKFKFSEFGKKNNLQIIKSSLKLEKNIYKKYVVKERFGSGSNNIGINLNFNQAKNFAKNLENPIYQKFIKGKEISIDAWISKNYIIKGIVLRSRELVIRGESKVTKTFVNDKIEKKIKNILEKLKITGHVVIQGIIDKKNSFQVIECNARFGGASSLSFKKGLHSFYWSILELLGKNLKNYHFDIDRRITKQLRYEEDKYFYDNNF